ncbi:MAG TPA: putative aminohydrolase SsnA [Firmicutes bacterium]|nr:putative aminohydrolase SsnA [Bacillota bacterium]
MAEKGFLLGNGTVITMEEKNRFLRDGAILVKGELIQEIGNTAELRARHPDAEFTDARGMLVLPGLVCAHSHLYGQWVRGAPGKGQAPANWKQILERLWWKVDKALSPEDNYWQSAAGIVEAIRYGATTLFDHHASPHSAPGSLDQVGRAFTELGIRGCLAYEVSDRDGPAIAGQGLEENRRFIERCQKERHPLLRGSFGLHASLTLGDDTLRRAAEMGHSLGTGFHVHVAEDRADLVETGERHGLHPVRRLADMGILNEKSIAAHCVHVGPAEIAILKESGCTVAHNPQSNMNNAVGISPVPDMLQAGVNVALGGDGFWYDLFREFNLAPILARLGKGDPRQMGGEDLRRLVWVNNARLCAHYWEHPLGQLTEGGYADIILVDYRPFTPLDESNFMGHLTYAVSGALVDTTIVGGRVLMKGKELQSIDAERIFARSRELARALWERY